MRYTDRHNKAYIGLLNFEGDVFRAYEEGNGIFTIVDEKMNTVVTCTADTIIQVMEGRVQLRSAHGRVYNFAEEHANAKPTKKALYNFLKVERPVKETAIEFAKWMRRVVMYEAVVDTFFYDGKAYENIEQLYDLYEKSN
jgi:hypothetical protein